MSDFTTTAMVDGAADELLGHELSIEVSGAGENEHDPAYTDAVRVIYGVTELLETLKAGRRWGHPAAYRVPEDYVAELEAAFRTGREHLLGDVDDAVIRDLAELDDQALADLEATVGTVAPHLGIEIDWPDWRRSA